MNLCSWRPDQEIYASWKFGSIWYLPLNSICGQVCGMYKINSILWCIWVVFIIWHTAIWLVVTLCYVQAQAPGIFDRRRNIRNNRRVQPIKSNKNQFRHAQSKTLTMNQSTYTYTTHTTQITCQWRGLTNQGTIYIQLGMPALGTYSFTFI